MIRWTTVFLDRPAATFDATRDFWLAVTEAVASPVRGDRGEFLTVLPPVGDAHLRMQRVDDGPGGSHIDLHVDDVAAALQHAVAAGATVLDDRGGLVVMRSPGGLAVCVVAHHGEVERPPPAGESGRRTRVDQLCLDIAPDRFDDECRFWSDVSGWQLRPGVEPEYATLARATDHSYRYLLQRCGPGDAGRATRCHLDLACDDIDRSVDDHVAIGARFVERFPWWAVMADPAGIAYCLTRRNPD